MNRFAAYAIFFCAVWTPALLPRPAAAGPDPGTRGGEIMTNEKVLELWDAGVPKSIILKKIQDSENAFDMTTKAMKELQSRPDPKLKPLDQDIMDLMYDAWRRNQDRLRNEISILIQTFRSAKDDERAEIIRRLVGIGKQAIPVLLKHKSDDNERIRTGVLDVIGQVADDATVMPEIFLDLTYHKPSVRAAAARAVEGVMSRLGAEERAKWEEKLLAMLRSARDPRDGAAFALGYLRDAKYVKPLRALAETDAREDALSRAAAAFALGLIAERTGDRSTNDLLRRMLTEDRDADVRVSAGRALMIIKDYGAISAFLRAMDRHDANLAHYAIQVGVFKEPRSQPLVERLIDLLQDNEAKVRGNAHASLKAITGETMPEDHAQWKAWLDLLPAAYFTAQNPGETPKKPEPVKPETPKKPGGDEKTPPAPEKKNSPDRPAGDAKGLGPVQPAYVWSDGNVYTIPEPELVKNASLVIRDKLLESYQQFRTAPAGAPDAPQPK
jgi:HEAT repeat protein